MHTGQNSIARENSLPQLGEVRWGSVFMALPVLPRRLKLRNGHGFPIYIQYVQQQRMREIVKVTFNSTPADQGFPIAPWYTWHHFRSISWNGTRWVEVPDYG